MAKPSKKIVIDILKKLELEYTEKITLDRAKAKIERAIEKDEELFDDVDFTEAEVAGLKQMGIELEFEEEIIEEVEAEQEPEPEEEEEPKEEAAPAKKKRKKNPPTEPTERKASKKMDKYTAVCIVLKKRKNHTLDQITEEANALYIENGGSDNISGTMSYTLTIVRILKEWGAIEQDIENVKVL